LNVRDAGCLSGAAAFSDTFQISSRIRGRETLVQRHQEDRSAAPGMFGFLEAKIFPARLLKLDAARS
jgi:hypothetical protein